MQSTCEAVVTRRAGHYAPHGHTAPGRARLRRGLLGDRSGVAAIEMAIALPILLVLMMGIVSYGQWLSIAHAVQQSANEGARASLAGLTSAERATFANRRVSGTLADTISADASKIAIGVQDDGASFAINVTYDATGDPLLSLPMVVMPDKRITRRAVIELSGL